jgi:hypothetical protein
VLEGADPNGQLASRISSYLPANLAEAFYKSSVCLGPLTRSGLPIQRSGPHSNRPNWPVGARGRATSSALRGKRVLGSGGGAVVDVEVYSTRPSSCGGRVVRRASPDNYKFVWVMLALPVASLPGSCAGISAGAPGNLGRTGHLTITRKHYLHLR